MEISFEQAHDDLLKWCRQRDFAGYDPFDALNSRIFQFSPLKHSSVARLLWTQAFKRSLFNLRPLTFVPHQKNAKGVALFALARLSNYRRVGTSEAGKEARQLFDVLLRMRIAGYSGAAWGYNFDWQNRKFFAPRDTPMIVPTAFAVRALTEGYETFGDQNYLATARSSCEFILHDLNRTVESDEHGHEVCFSYSPLDQTKVFNASLFAAETLATVAALSSDSDFGASANNLALRAARYVIRRQNDDGSWFYGDDSNQSWIDNFHSAYVLLSLSRILKCVDGGDNEVKTALDRGYAFWRDRFFLADGWPKYYDDTLFPADAHSAATAIIALIELRELDRHALGLAERIGNWTIRNLRDPQGYFYYQRRRYYTVRMPFMRWTQAWMLYALARLLETR